MNPLPTIDEKPKTLLRELLQHAELTQRELSELLGETEALVSFWAKSNGACRANLPRILALEKLKGVPADLVLDLIKQFD